MLFVSANYSLVYTLTYLSMCVYVCLVGFLAFQCPLWVVSGTASSQEAECRNPVSVSQLMKEQREPVWGPSPILQPHIKLSSPHVFLDSSLPYIPHGQLWQTAEPWRIVGQLPLQTHRHTRSLKWTAGSLKNRKSFLIIGEGCNSELPLSTWGPLSTDCLEPPRATDGSGVSEITDARFTQSCSGDLALPTL